MAQSLRKSKSKSALQAENRMLRAHGIGDGITKIIQAIIKYGVVAYIAYNIRLIAIEWAGKNTTANIDVKADVSVDINNAADSAAGAVSNLCDQTIYIALFVMVAAIGYGKAQAILRRRVIERMHPYQEAAEKQIDPERTSSRLTNTGDTRPEDH